MISASCSAIESIFSIPITAADQALISFAEQIGTLWIFISIVCLSKKVHGRSCKTLFGESNNNRLYFKNDVVFYSLIKLLSFYLYRIHMNYIRIHINLLNWLVPCLYATLFWEKTIIFDCAVRMILKLYSLIIKLIVHRTGMELWWYQFSYCLSSLLPVLTREKTPHQAETI